MLDPFTLTETNEDIRHAALLRKQSDHTVITSPLQRLSQLSHYSRSTGPHVAAVGEKENKQAGGRRAVA